MKKTLTILLFILILSSCKKDDEPYLPIDQLPPETQIGAQTIGCLVNGEAFAHNLFYYNNFYQFVEGEFHLVINWDMNTSKGWKYGQISLDNIDVKEGQTYILNISDYAEDNNYTGGNGTYASYDSTINKIIQYETNSNYIGKIHFTRFDTENFIMSGTFEFEAKDIMSGESISITDGRFDLNFTN